MKKYSLYVIEQILSFRPKNDWQGLVYFIGLLVIVGFLWRILLPIISIPFKFANATVEDLLGQSLILGSLAFAGIILFLLFGSIIVVAYFMRLRDSYIRNKGSKGQKIINE